MFHSFLYLEHYEGKIYFLYVYLNTTPNLVIIIISVTTKNFLRILMIIPTIFFDVHLQTHPYFIIHNTNPITSTRTHCHPHIITYTPLSLHCHIDNSIFSCTLWNLPTIHPSILLSCSPNTPVIFEYHCHM